MVDWLNNNIDGLKNMFDWLNNIINGLRNMVDWLNTWLIGVKRDTSNDLCKMKLKHLQCVHVLIECGGLMHQDIKVHFGRKLVSSQVSEL